MILARTQTEAAGAGFLALGLIYGVLHELRDLKLYVVETIAAGLAAGVVYFVVLYLLERTPDRAAVMWILLAGALVFRLQLFPLAPKLSDDIHRYRWDARVAAAGWNPYAVHPDDARLAGLRASHGGPVPGRDIATIYPPLAEMLYLATQRVLANWPAAAQVVIFKLPFLAADLALLGLLAWWIRSTGGRNHQLAIYAWNPLVIVEIAASGHNDAVAMAAVLAAGIVIIRGRAVVSTLLLTAAALVKLFPVVLFPLWLRRAGWPGKRSGWAAAGAAGALAAVCVLPYGTAWREMLATAVDFEARWQGNNASLWGMVVWFSGSRELASGIGFGVVAGLAAWVAVRRLDLLRAAYILVGAILLLSPNAFPWYFTWMVPLLCFFPNPAWLLLTVLQFVSYHVLIEYQASGVWRFQPFYLWLTYVPFFGLLIGTSIVEKKLRSI